MQVDCSFQSKDRLTKWKQKQDPCACLVCKRLISDLKMQSESERVEKAFCTNGNEEKPRVAIFISDTVDFKTYIYVYTYIHPT